MKTLNELRVSDPINWDEHLKFNDLHLPPLPTSGIPDGSVGIDEVEEVWQFRHDPSCDWLDSNVRDEYESFADYQQSLSEENIETRTALRKKQPEES